MTLDRFDTDTVEHEQLSWSDRLLPILLLASIGVGLGVGLIAPGAATALSHGVSIGVFALIFVVMLGVGVDGMRSAFGERRFLATAVVLNFMVNPLIAWALGATLLGDSPDLRVGLLLFLVTPCIGWYLVFTDLAGGDTTLGVGILGINIALQILLLPVYLAVFVGDSTTVPMSTIGRSVGLYLVGPALLAVATRRHWRRRRIDPVVAQQQLRLPAVKAGLLAVVIVSMFASEAQTIIDQPSVFARLIAPLALFFATAFAIALVVGRRSGLPYEQLTLLAFTTTSRNSEASLAIAATAFVSPLVGLTVVIGPVIELPLLVAMFRVLSRLRPSLET